MELSIKFATSWLSSIIVHERALAVCTVQFVVLGNHARTVKVHQLHCFTLFHVTSHCFILLHNGVPATGHQGPTGRSVSRRWKKQLLVLMNELALLRTRSKRRGVSKKGA